MLTAYRRAVNDSTTPLKETDAKSLFKIHFRLVQEATGWLKVARAQKFDSVSHFGSSQRSKDSKAYSCKNGKK